MTSSIDFEPILAELEADKELGEKLREQVKELERTFRVAAKVLNKSHSTTSSQSRFGRCLYLSDQLCYLPLSPFF